MSNKSSNSKVKRLWNKFSCTHKRKWRVGAIGITRNTKTKRKRRQMVGGR